ncbi:hypothetical protein [Luteibaculum oceani]|uniref:Rod shape-determining protein MreD n=1 Tax=Luteibaculum oceani TaxID=1294296 RepID=A0A5C6UTP7_9FLAO|nr:hypothetical protein [Luteibaculum oceani]TXC75611.1 hypothetical protein FRX97_11565 [Luteibaculum oceani]
MGKLAKILLRTLLIVLIQVWILDQVNIMGTWVVLFIYPLAIIKLPVKIPTIPSMLIGLAIGLLVDVFTGTYGLNASCGLILGYLKPKIIALISGREELEEIQEPGLFRPGLQWFLTLTLFILLAHSLWYFNLSQFQLSSFFKIQGRALLSTLFSFLLIILAEVLFANQKRK